MNEKQASVAARIAELACLPMSELWTVWDRYFRAARTTPTARTSSPGSPTSCRRKPSVALRPRPASAWKPSAQNIPRSSCGPPREFDFAPGTILLREWGEREHKVTVTAEGLFEYQGATSRA